MNANLILLLQRQVYLLSQLLALKSMKPLLERIVYHLDKRHDASPTDLAPDPLGCAETATTILKEVYPETPIFVGTGSLYDYLQHPKNGWVRSPVPKPGCIIISPTGMGKVGTHGHVGFVLENNDDIGSNSSDPKTLGLFIRNFTIKSWVDSFSALGYPTFYFIRK